MKKILLLVLLASCNYPKYNDYHWGAHRFDSLVDTFTQNGIHYEVRQCTKGYCQKTDTFPNPHLNK